MQKGNTYFVEEISPSGEKELHLQKKWTTHRGEAVGFKCDDAKQLVWRCQTTSVTIAIY